jgi:hypothetical protein
MQTNEVPYTNIMRFTKMKPTHDFQDIFKKKNAMVYRNFNGRTPLISQLEQGKM